MVLIKSMNYSGIEKFLNLKVYLYETSVIYFKNHRLMNK